MKRVEELLQFHRFQVLQFRVAPPRQEVGGKQELILPLRRVLEVRPRQAPARFIESSYRISNRKHDFWLIVAGVHLEHKLVCQTLCFPLRPNLISAPDLRAFPCLARGVIPI